jgi:predicted O-methyltransferase YrrM
MRRLYISESALSEMFWSRLLGSSDAAVAKADAELIIRETKIIHRKFPQDTAGSISLESTAMLWLIAKYFEPTHVFEIGTFIGRSAMAILSGASTSIERLDTCDYTFNQFYFTDSLKASIPKYQALNYWPLMGSVQVLQQVITNNLRPDMFFIDGRIGADDLKLLSMLDRSKTVYVLDDFEGTEKGVENCIALRSLYPEYILIRPYTLSNGRSMNTAILVPPSLLAISRQQELPISMQ